MTRLDHYHGRYQAKGKHIVESKVFSQTLNRISPNLVIRGRRVKVDLSIKIVGKMVSRSLHGLSDLVMKYFRNPR